MSDLKRICLFVAGMHRSGTSAVAGALALLGCTLPKQLLPGNFSNTKGHFEPERLVILNDELLQSMSSSWDDCLPVAPTWFDSSVAESFCARTEVILREEYDNSPLFVLKDPRSNRILPLVIKALATCGAEARFILSFRDPGEVACSLTVRDGSIFEQGLLLWIGHLLDAERFTRGMKRCFFDYGSFIAEWPTILPDIERKLDLAFPRNLDRIGSELAAFLEPGMRHEVSGPADRTRQDGVFPLTRRVLQAYEQLTLNPHDTHAQASLDEVSDVFARFLQLGGPTLHRTFVNLRRLKESLTVAEHQLKASEVQMEALQQQQLLDELRQELDRTVAEHQLKASEVQMEALQQQQLLDELRQELDRTVAEHQLKASEAQMEALQQQQLLDELRQELDRTRNECAMLERTNERAEEACTVTRQQLIGHQQRAARQDERLAQLRASASWRITMPLRVVSKRLNARKIRR